jgi:glycosyltransferase involved in cell wall biosynthesis
MQKTLALVMVVKNEEKGLEKAILSCKNFVNEIIIAVDSSSEDGTLEIAKKYATEYKIFEWDDDFSAARNFAHEGVKSDYILFLDGHEYVEKCENLQKYLSADFDGLLVSIKMETGAEFRSPRIYKNGCQFSGRVHEKVLCKKVMPFPYFIIQHNRISGQAKGAADIREQQRGDMMERIMALEAAQDNSNVRATFHLALYYHSIAKYKLAFMYEKLYLKYSKLPGERYYLLFHRSLVFLSLGKRFRAFWALSRAESEEPKRWETEKLRGMILFEAGKYEKALVSLVNSFNQNEKEYAYKPWPRDDAGTWNLIGECFFRRGVYAKACTAFEQASEQAEGKQKYFFQQRAKLMEKIALESTRAKQH